MIPAAALALCPGSVCPYIWVGKGAFQIESEKKDACSPQSRSLSGLAAMPVGMEGNYAGGDKEGVRQGRGMCTHVMVPPFAVTLI
jgi:hypothetical protein